MFVQEQVDQTYIMVKPDGVQRGLVSLLISYVLVSDIKG